jgi:hypothetical protein
MPAYMFDGAYDADMIDECKAAGGIAMSHYLTGTHAGTSAQPHAIRAKGMGAVENYERAAGELVGASRSDGQDIARRALGGVDPDCPRDGTIAVYFSVDVAVALRDITACDNGFAGINDILGSAFIPKTYAEGALIDHLVGKGLVQSKQWLSASSSYPGYNPDSGNVCMVQQVGTFVPKTDRNLITDPYAIGAWWPDNSPYVLGDDPMAGITLDEIADAVWHHKMQGQLTTDYQADQLITDIRAIIAAVRDNASSAANHAAAADTQTDGLAAQFAAQRAQIVADVTGLITTGGAPSAVAEAVADLLAQRLGGAA